MLRSLRLKRGVTTGNLHLFLGYLLQAAAVGVTTVIPQVFQVVQVVEQGPFLELLHQEAQELQAKETTEDPSTVLRGLK